MATQSTVTGPIQAPTATTPTRGFIRFQLTDWDAEGGTIITTTKVEAPISNEDFSISLWASSEGDRGTNYKVTAFWYNATEDKWVQDEMGYCEVGASGPYSLGDILVDEPIEPTPVDVLAEAQAALVAAEAAIDIAESARDDAEAYAISAEESADRVDLGALDDALSAAVSAQYSAGVSATDAQDAADVAQDAVQYDYFVDDETALLAIVGMSDGDYAFVRDTGDVWEYQTSAWVDLGESPSAMVTAGQKSAANARADFYDIAGHPPRLVLDFARQSYLYRNTDGTISATVLSKLLSSEQRDSTLDYTDADGNTQTAAIDELAFDYSEGGGGLLSTSVDAGTSDEQRVWSSYSPTKGAALIEVYPPKNWDASLPGIFGISAGGAFQGVSLLAQNASGMDYGRVDIHIDDGTSSELYTIGSLIQGLNRIFISWDMTTGECSTAINGSPLNHWVAPSGWSPVTTTRTMIGKQNTIGAGADQVYNGVIASVTVYGQDLGGYVTRDSDEEGAIQEKCRPTQLTKGFREIVGIPSMLADFKVASPDQVKVNEERDHFVCVARTGDFVADGDEDDYKVRSGVGREPSFTETDTLYISWEMMVPTFTWPDWGLLFQLHNGAKQDGVHTGVPPISINPERTTGEIELRNTINDASDPGEPITTTLAVLPVNEGQWHSYDMYVELSQGSPTGVLKLWVDRVLVYSGTGIQTAYNRDSGYDEVYASWMVYRGMDTDEQLYYTSGGVSGTQKSVRAEFRGIRCENYAFPGAMS